MSSRPGIILIERYMPENAVKEFRAGKLHVVAVAAPGLTTCDFFASTVADINQADVQQHSTRINRLLETGTFWPLMPLTLVPAPDGRVSDHREFYRVSLRDTFAVNAACCRCREMHFDLEGYSVTYDTKWAQQLLIEMLQQGVVDPHVERVSIMVEKMFAIRESASPGPG